MVRFNVAAAAAVLAAALASLSWAPLHAQTAAPQMQCPQSGMGMQHGMMSGHMEMGSGPADRAYMQAMMGMHQGMMQHPMTGNADRDFMLMMIPHHQAAVGMAKAELQYGTNPKLRAMAQSIIRTQEAEIAQMQAMMK